MATKKLIYEEIGPVVFAASRRSKRISITVGAFKPVRVSYPERVSFNTAREYLHKNIEWVRKSRVKASGREQQMNDIWRDAPPIDIQAEAQRLYNRIRELAAMHNYRFAQVTFRNQKTRWGSCSSANNISLNINLARLPQHLSDYVLLHELAHTKVRNHGKDFWQELNDKTDNKARLLDKEISKYPIPQR
jgi:predicted metal-dependent hydrolase